MLLLTGCSKKQKQEVKVNQKEYVKVPEFSVSYIDDSKEQFTNENLSGAVIISVVSDFCTPCAFELETFHKIRQNYTEQQLESYIMVVGKNDKSLKMIDSLGMKSEVLVADSFFLGKMNIHSIPTRLLIANNQEIMRIIGTPAYEEKDFVMKINELLGIVIPDSTSENDSLKSEKK